MTLTFDRETYGSLLARYQPKVIETEEENDLALALVEELGHRLQPTPEELALLDLLVTLIEKFEAVAYPIPESSPLDVLHHLMEARECKQEDLVGVLGSRGIVSEVVNGKRSISKAQARALAEYFHVEAGMFV